MSKARNQENEYGIGAVARMTGLTTQVIRAWERRYEAVVARRADNGRRIYSSADVEKLALLKSLTDRGTAISAIAGLDVDTLRSRASEMDQISARPLTGDVRVAVLGAFLPALLAGEADDANRPFDIVASDADPDRFAADTRNLSPDVVVIEATHLDERVTAMIERLRADSGATRFVLAYGFGRSRDEQALVRSGVRLLRTPVSGDELSVAILAAATSVGTDKRRRAAPAKPAATNYAAGAPAPRRYSQEQLLRLARLQTDVDCECPHHVAEILRTLTAFEVYSADCENRDARDAALHAYLHRCTASARAMMEEALDRLIEVEQIDL